MMLNQPSVKLIDDDDSTTSNLVVVNELEAKINDFMDGLTANHIFRESASLYGRLEDSW